MRQRRLGPWLPRLAGTATFVYIAALCLAVALLVIAFIPNAPVMVDLPIRVLSRLDSVGGLAPGVVVDSAGQITVKITDPSLAQRMLYLAITLPGLLLVAEVARRMAKLLRAGQGSDPFTAQTAHRLTVLAKITAFGGLGVWLVSDAAKGALSTTLLDSGTAVQPPQWALLGWLTVGLIFAAFGQLIAHGVALRAELDTVI